jgi:hypothetical protein
VAASFGPQMELPEPVIAISPEVLQLQLAECTAVRAVNNLAQNFFRFIFRGNSGWHFPAFASLAPGRLTVTVSPMKPWSRPLRGDRRQVSRTGKNFNNAPRSAPSPRTKKGQTRD